MALPLKPVPALLPDGSTMVGTGNRQVKIGFITVNVYSAAFYCEASGAATELATYAGHSIDDLLSDPGFFPDLVRGKFCKAFRITFCRSLPRAKMVDGFMATLGSRVSSEHKGEAEELVGKMIPENGFVEDNILTVQVREDGQTISAAFQATSFDEAKTVVEVNSSVIWEAFQGQYFDDNTEVPAVKQGFVQGMPDLLESNSQAPESLAGSSPSRDRALTPHEIGDVASQCIGASTHGPSMRSWKSVSGRDGGKEGYKFGDLTRSAWKKVFVGAPTDNSETVSNELCSTPNNEPSSTQNPLQQKLAESQVHIKQLEEQIAKLQTDLKATDARMGALRTAFFILGGLLVWLLLPCMLFTSTSLFVIPWIFACVVVAKYSTKPKNGGPLLLHVFQLSEGIGASIISFFPVVDKNA